MIIAVGTDLCEVDRIESALLRSGDRFLARVFTARERQAASEAEHPARVLARFFAIKESAFKTLRRGWPYGVGFLEVELETPALLSGRLLLSGRAAGLASARGASRFMGASAADEEIAAAVVIAEVP